MITCACGNYVDGKSTACNRCTALRILDLDTNATETDIRSSYRTLVKVWHPDRFQSDQKLKEAAENKLKDINSAYEFLISTPQTRADWQRPNHRSEYTPPAGPTSEEAAAANSRVSHHRWSQRFSQWTSLAFKTFLRLAAFALVILFFRYLWIAFNVPVPTAEEAARAVDTGKDDLLKGLEEPKRRFMQAVMKDLRKLTPNMFLATPPQTAQPQPGSDSQANRKAPEKPAARQPTKIDAAPHKIFSYITIGSTKDEVLAIQGPPAASSDDKLVYGRSELYLKDGSVIGWKIDPVSDPIRVKLWPQHSVDTSQDYFTVDSTKDDVLVVQGTPTAFSNDKFQYGGSEVYFRNNRVARWKNDPATIPLKVKNP